MSTMIETDGEFQTESFGHSDNGSGKACETCGAVDWPDEDEKTVAAENKEAETQAAISKRHAYLIFKSPIWQMEPDIIVGYKKGKENQWAQVFPNIIFSVGRLDHFRVKDFVGSVMRLAWAKAMGCPWTAETCSIIAERGDLRVLMWARAQNPQIPWDERTCAIAARRGFVAMLKWARQNGLCAE